MNESCKFDIKFNPFKISISFKEWLNQKGALNDRGSFYEMLSNPINDEEKVNNIIRILKNTYKNQFYTDDEEAVKIVDYVVNKELQKRIPEFECDLDLLLEKFQQEFKKVITETTDNPKESSVNDNNVEESDLAVKSAMNYYFSKTPGTQTLVHEHFKTNIRQRLFINLEEGKMNHGGDLALNRMLIDYQSKLFERIVSYINLQRDSNVSPDLYNESGRLTPEYKLIMQEAFDIIKDKMGSDKNNENSEHVKLLNKGWESIQYRDSRGSASSMINWDALKYSEFVESFYLLKYFDDNFVHNFGNIVWFSPGNKNIPTAKHTFQKYKYGVDRRNRRKDYTNKEENRNGFEEADRFSLGLLESLPMISYAKFNASINSGKSATAVQDSKLSKNIEYIQLTSILSKLKNFCVLNKIEASADSEITSTNEQFIEAVSRIGDNQKRNLGTILSIIFKEGKYNHSKNRILETLRENGVLEEDDINILFGLYLSGFNADYTIKTEITKIVNNVKSLLNKSEACNKFLDTFDLNPSLAIRDFISSKCVEFNNLSKDDLNLLRKYKNNPYLLGNSIIKIENNERSKKFNTSSFIYSDCIAGVLDRVIELQYMSVDYDKSNGELEIKLRKKWNDNGRIYDLQSSINEYVSSKSQDEREKLLTKYKLSGSEGTFIIDLGNNVKIRIDLNTKYNMYSQYNNVEIQTPTQTQFLNIYEYFKNYNFAENSSDLTTDGKEINTIFTFLKDVLGYNFLNKEESSQILYLYKLRHSRIFRELLNNGFKALVANHALYTYNSLEIKPVEFPEWLYSQYEYKQIFSNIGEYNKLGKFRVKYNKTLNQLKDTYSFNVVSVSESFVDNLVEAESQFRGVTTRSTSTNYAGHKEQNGRTAFLGGKIQQRFSEICDALDNYVNQVLENAETKQVASANLLFTQKRSNRSLLKGFIMSSDILSNDGKVVKSIKQLNDSELLFNSIFYNFYGCLTSSDERINGNILILPTTYSDKGSIITYLVDGNSVISIGNKNYQLSNLSDSDAANILYNTIGKFYLSIAYNTILDYVKMFPEMNFGNIDNLIVNDSINVEELKTFIKNINRFLVSDEIKQKYGITDKYKLLDRAQIMGVELTEDKDYSEYNGMLTLNPLLYHYIDSYYTPKGFSNILRREKINFLNSILKSNLYIATDDIAVLNALSTLDKTERNSWVDEGMLVIAKQKLADGTYKNIIQQGELLSEDADIEINPLLSRYFNSNTVLASNLRNTLTGTELGHPLSKTNAYKKKTLNTALSLLFNMDLSKVSIIQLKEIIDAAPNNAIKKQALDIFNKTMIELESIAGAEGALLKRNSIIPATGQSVLQQTINGVPKFAKIAVIEDVQAYVNLFDGFKDHEDSQDGSGINCAFAVDLINRSLQALKVGIDMKPIWHDYDPTTGSDSQLKYALFGITNLRMQQSLNGDTSLFNLHKLMTNLQWKENGVWTNSRGVAIDLVNGKRYGRNRLGEPSTSIDFNQDILLGDKLIYGFGLNYKQIVNLGKQKFEGIGDEIYYTEELSLNQKGEPQSTKPYKVYQLFDADGNEYKFSEQEVIDHIKDITSGKLHTINSLFELHMALGGIMCVEFNDSSLKFVTSEKNISYVVNYMNIVSNQVQLTDRGAAQLGSLFKNDNIVDQDSYYQPLKEMMIFSCVNGSGMKNGRRNVNKADRWQNGEKLNYMTIRTKGFSIQQDSDHEADESELTEPTQVMTALSQGGHLHKYANQIYNSIGRLSLLATSVELSAVKEFLKKIEKSKTTKNKQNALNVLYDTVGRIVLNNLSSNNTDKDLSTEICEAIKSRFGINPDDHFVEDTFLIPFSDPSIYGHFFPTIISVINSKGIRRKNPGSGMVMAPSYGMFQIYDIGGLKYTMSDIINIAQNATPFDSESSSTVTTSMLRSLVLANLQESQLQETVYDYNPFDLGDRIHIIGNVLNKLNSATVIWGHPASGKTYLHELGRTDIIDFDSEYKSRINQLMGLPEGADAKELRKAARKNRKQEYHDLIMLLFDEAVNEAKTTGKKLLVSDLMLLKEREADIDVITNMSDDKFIERSALRGETDSKDKMLWKNDINEAMNSVVDKSKIITTHNFMSLDLSPINVASIYIDRIDKFYAILDGNWAKVSGNKILEDYAKNHKISDVHRILSRIGLTNFIQQIYSLNPNDTSILELSQDRILLLYDCSEFKFLKDVMHGRDLAPTRIQFMENGFKKSIYSIPTIKLAFTSNEDIPRVTKNGKIQKPIMDAIMEDLSNGYYCNSYFLTEDGLDVVRGTRYTISDIQYLPPETIISNMTASKFGVHYSDTLQQASKSINFDIDTYVSNLKLYSKGIDMRFLTRNGNHTLIKFSPIKISSRNQQYLEVEFFNIPRRKLYKASTIYPKYYQEFVTDNNNVELFETSRLIFMKDLKIVDKKIVNEKDEVIEDKTLVKIGKEVYKKFDFLKKYNYIDGDRNHILYTIDEQLIDEMSKLLASEANAEEYKRKLIADIIETLYSQEQYLGFDYNKETINTSLLKNKSGILNKLATNHTELQEYCKSLQKVINASKEESIALAQETVDKVFRNMLEDYKLKLLTSFEISKFLISSRIPAQTLQSFMLMEVAGYTQMPTNVAYVSAIQTFLQGSDYDIDKAYMLTHFFDNNGMYATWSPLMNLSNMSLYLASTELPVPLKVQLFKADSNVAFSTDYILDSQQDKLSEEEKNAINVLVELIKNNPANDITSYLVKIVNSSSEEERIRNMSDLIDHIDNNQKSVYLNNDKETTPIFLYTFNEKYTDDLGVEHIIINSKDAENILQQVLMHEDFEIPESIKELTIQNANTAKIALIIKNLANVNSAHLHIEMSYAREAAQKKESNTKNMTLWNVANILHMLYENLVGKNVIGIAANGEKGYFTLYYYFTECLKRIMNNDINSQELKVMTVFNKRFNKLNNNENITRIANLNKLYLTDKEAFKFEVDLMISLLLSAATDNAKELILAKINAGADLAKIYFYGLILGIDLKDLADFMTSPVVDLIAELVKPSMFDLDRKHISIEQVLHMIVNGDYLFYNYMDNGLFRTINSGLALAKITTHTTNGEIEVKSLNEFCILKNQNLVTETLWQFINRNRGKFDENADEFGIYISEKNLKSIQRLSQFIEGTSKKIYNVRQLYATKEDFESILKDFNMLLQGANELTNFTNIYLNTNLGIPTTVDKFLNKLDGITKTVLDREKALGINTLKNKLDSLEKIKNIIIALNPDLASITGDFVNGKMNYFIPKSYIDSVLEAAQDLGIIYGFDYKSWLNNPTYQEVTKHYYNCIKSTFNIFHFLEIHPQFNANFKLFEASYELVNNLCFKSHFSEVLHSKIKKEVKYWDSRNDKYIVLNLTSHIIRTFLQENNISIKVDPSWELLNDVWIKTKDTGKEFLLLEDLLDQSNFKLVFENYIIPGLKNGTLKVKDSSGKSVTILNNDFIQGLTQKVKFNRPYYALDVDTAQSKGSAAAMIKSTKYRIAFMDLKNYKMPDCEILTKSSDGKAKHKTLTLEDMFVLYNLIVNKNQYGANTLTELLKTSIDENNRNSLLVKYLSFVGLLDSRALIEKESTINYLKEDILMDAAPVISKYQELFYTDKYVKVREEGILTLKQRINNKYVEIPFYKNEYGEDEYNPSSDAEVNRLKYSCLQSSADRLSVPGNRLLSKNYNIVLSTLRGMYGTQNLLAIRNC